MPRTTGPNWRSLVFTGCALGVSLSAGVFAQGQTLADVTRPVARANKNSAPEVTQTASSDAGSSEEIATAPKKKSWTSWLPWQREKQQQATAKTGPQSPESPSESKPVTVNRPSSPRGSDRHFPPPQPVTDPKAVATVKGASTTGQPTSPKPKKSLLQSLRKPSWSPFAQREKGDAHQRPLNDEGQPVAAGQRSTNIVEYPDVVPTKYRTGTLGGTRSATRDEKSSAAQPAPDSLAGPAQQPARDQRLILDKNNPPAESSSAQSLPANSLPAATPSLVRSFRRPPPDPVPSLPDEAITEAVTHSELEQPKANTAVGTGPLYDIVSAACRSGSSSSNPTDPVMLQSVPQRDGKSKTAQDSLQFVPTKLTGRDNAKGVLDAVAVKQPITASSEMKSGPSVSPTASVAAARPATNWTAKRPATMAGDPTPSTNNVTVKSATPYAAAEKAVAINGAPQNAAGNASTSSVPKAVTDPSVPGQPAMQVNPFAPPPASRLAAWPDTGPRRMTSRTATPPAALLPLPSGGAANLAAATEPGMEFTNVETPAVEKTPTQVQPMMTTRASAVEPVSAVRDQGVERVPAEAVVETPRQVIAAADKSEGAKPSVSVDAVPESRTSSDPDGSWVDAYQQLMQRKGQTNRRPAAGSPTRRLSSDDQQPAAPIRRR